ncbi:hypothetical protein B9Z55_026094 [Caenorhabditis nigoni]|uniref:Uncharacterized protein n=1 Tax=Caenorhabditis nigoni TaxID=1611254 RepID=A0A2G5T173_9PELO|nr:hypothetical protein B9Z55_026094 [Caenorhabditis nigoni]
MNNRKFPFHRLPDDLCTEILINMSLREMTFYSFLSKKAHSMIRALGLPISFVDVTMTAQLRITLRIDDYPLKFELRMPEISEGMTTLNDLPDNVQIMEGNEERNFEPILSNQGMTLSEWIRHLSSFSDDSFSNLRVAIFVERVKFDIPSLRKTFPKMRNIHIICWKDEPDEHDILNAQKLLRVSLCDAQNMEIHHVPLQEKLSLQHIGMTNLKELELIRPINLKLDQLSTWNVESCSIETNEISLRDLNRFFKLWVKGSNRNLKKLLIWGNMDVLPDWNILLKGLKPIETEPEEEEAKKVLINNYRGIRAGIEFHNFGETIMVTFTVPN